MAELKEKLLNEFSDLKDSMEFYQDNLVFITKKNWDYQNCLETQNSLNQFVYEYPELRVFIFCNHPPCFTDGRGLQKKSGKPIESLIEGNRENLPYPLYKINRAGGMTFHHPGQVVIYPIVRIGTKLSLKSLVDLLFLSIQNFVKSEFTLNYERKCAELLGLWNEGQKVASLGIEVKKFITLHGIAFNIEDHEIFQALNSARPCGISGDVYTSLEKQIGKKVEIDRVFEKTKRELISSLSDI